MNKRSRIRICWVAFVALGWSAAVIGSTAAAQANQEPDALVEAVRAKLKVEQLDTAVTAVAFRDGLIVLTGEPGNAWLKMKVIEAALAVEGVESVESELEVAGPESSQELARALVERVLTYSDYTVFDDITFGIADGGLVTLGGAVTNPLKKEEIEERVGRITGVSDLSSEIRVLPLSTSDDRLRRQLFVNIYNDPIFMGLGDQVRPPIHIIVDGADVTLTGAVRSNLEKVKAENIARTTSRVMQVENRLQINP